MLFFSADGQSTSFSYNPASPNGPSNWGSISPDSAICGTGQSQSPIDIPRSVLDGTPATAPTVNNATGSYTIQNKTVNFALKCSSCGSLSIEGSTYNLIDIHFHTPSEHTRQGRSFPLEAHLVHQNAQGQLAVVGILYEIGAPNPGFSTILNSLPSSSFSLSTASLQLGPSAYCRYSGSLTTPPCTEQVNWILTERISTVSQAQVQEYIKNIGRDGFGDGYGNNRPVLPINGRDVTCYP